MGRDLKDHAETKSSLASDERRRMYDASAKFYSLTFPLIWRFCFPGLHRWTKRELEGCQRVLDAGTGTGCWALWIAEADPQRLVTAVDFSPEFLKRARKAVQHDQVTFLEADIQDLPFEAGSFDGVFCCGVLDTFPDVNNALREFQRVLAPSGRILLVLRGKRGIVSRFSESLFRTYVGMTRAIRQRSLREFRVPDELWNREPLSERIREVSSVCGLSTIRVNQGRLMTTVTLGHVS